jgi:Leucine-rich repeat (LRR) protein
MKWTVVASLVLAIPLMGFSILAQNRICQPNEIILLEDRNVQFHIRDTLSKFGSELTCEDLARLQRLSTFGSNTYGYWYPDTRSLRGLEYAVNLQELIIRGTSVTDLIPLANLKKLRYLILADNKIVSLESLSQLNNLETLQLSRNAIQDIKPLTHLINLNEVGLVGNFVQDLSPLEQNPGLSAGDTISLEGNCLDLSPTSETSAIIQRLEARGVTVNVGTQRPASECSR